MDEPPTRKTKWNVREFAFLGALLGGFAGMVWEMSEIYLTDLSDPATAHMEPLGDMMTDIASAALGGAVLLAVVAALSNRIRKQER
jgi:hypothetical protein